MKRLLFAAFALFMWAGSASALLCPSVPNTFSNGTTADANQVNANFAALLTCLNTSTATSGANSNITGLSGLSTPPSGTGSLVFWGGTATGAGAAVVVGSTNPTGFALTTGNIVSFVASAASTGAATLAVNGTTAEALDKVSYAGVASALAAGDIAIGQTVSAIYDGTEYVIFSNLPPALRAPQVTVYTPGQSGTYTTPTGALSLEVEMVGAGGGGGGAGTTTTGGAGGAGGATTFGTSFLTANGGAATPTSGGTTVPTPAVASGGDYSLSGGLGGSGYYMSTAGFILPGPSGANSRLGNGGSGSTDVVVATTNVAAQPATGFGAGGGAGSYVITGGNVTLNSGWGGNAGAYLVKTITSPSATYSYSVGTTGTGGTAGTSGTAGANGSGGLIRIVARFQ